MEHNEHRSGLADAMGGLLVRPLPEAYQRANQRTRQLIADHNRARIVRLAEEQAARARVLGLPFADRPIIIVDESGAYDLCQRAREQWAEGRLAYSHLTSRAVFFGRGYWLPDDVVRVEPFPAIHYQVGQAVGYPDPDEERDGCDCYCWNCGGDLREGHHWIQRDADDYVCEHADNE